jgi:hypothetical protein
MSETIFSKKVQEYITNEMSICIDDLTNKILDDVPNSSWFFNDLFEYMMQLTIPYTYNYNNLSNPNNQKMSQYLDKELYEFLDSNGFTEDSDEHFIFDNIRHCFINFKENGIVRMYQYREAEVWYPKIIINNFLGITEDIEELDNEVLIYRGTSQDEYDSGIFGQSWSLSKSIANKFAFEYYKHQEHYQNTYRVVISTTINKDSILFYDKNGIRNEDEVIIDAKTLSKNMVKIEENEILKG